MKTQPYVFVPPGAGQRRQAVGGGASVASGSAAIRGGWVLSRWLAVLLFAVCLPIGFQMAKRPGAGYELGSEQQVEKVGWRLSEETKLAAVVLGSGAFVLAGYAAYALLSLYGLAWLVLPLVGLSQGDSAGALRFLLLSPLQILFLAGGGLLGGWFGALFAR